MSFSALGLSAHFLPTLEHLGFNTPTDVQKEAIPLALNGRDLMVSAQTGSGKTAAFMLPSLQRVTEQGAYLQYMERQAGLAAFAQKPGTHPQTHGQSKQRRSRRQRAQHKQRAQRAVSVLVLTPTRELAMQVGQATKDYAACLPGLQTAVVVGGVPYGPQIKALAGSVDVLVATPGRLMDHLKANRVTLGQVQTLVLDEADRMLDMGFIHDIRSIVSQTAQDRQTLLFSATLEASVRQLATQMMKKPKTIHISGPRHLHANIQQALLYADSPQHKQQLLVHLLQDAQVDQAVVFTATKRGADRLARRLAQHDFATGALHGDMNQRQRSRTLRQLQRKRIRILVATDVAARGIDVPGISRVINYDLPMQAEDYTHRIGRTGRAGNNGQAFTLALFDQQREIQRIERFIARPIDVVTIKGLEPSQSPKPVARPARKRSTKRVRRGGARSGAGASQSTRARRPAPLAKKRARKGNPKTALKATAKNPTKARMVRRGQQKASVLA